MVVVVVVVVVVLVVLVVVVVVVVGCCGCSEDAMSVCMSTAPQSNWQDPVPSRLGVNSRQLRHHRPSATPAPPALEHSQL